MQQIAVINESTAMADGEVQAMLLTDLSLIHI